MHTFKRETDQKCCGRSEATSSIRQRGRHVLDVRTVQEAHSISEQAHSSWQDGSCCSASSYVLAHLETVRFCPLIIRPWVSATEDTPEQEQSRVGEDVVFDWFSSLLWCLLLLSLVLFSLRLSLVTKPTYEMRVAMSIARVGDDVYHEDPTVNQFQEQAAKMFGKEDALFLASGTQSNLVAYALSSRERGFASSWRFFLLERFLLASFSDMFVF